MSYELRTAQYLRCDAKDCDKAVAIDIITSAGVDRLPDWPDGWKKHPEYGNEHRCPGCDWEHGQ